MIKKCVICNSEFDSTKKGHARKYCFNCVPSSNNRPKQISEIRTAIVNRVKEIHGNKCVICGYNKCTNALDFHHIIEENKSFGIGSGDIKVFINALDESEKCILVCSNCHREIHFTNIHDSFIKNYKHNINFKYHRDVFNSNY